MGDEQGPIATRARPEAAENCQFRRGLVLCVLAAATMHAGAVPGRSSELSLNLHIAQVTAADALRIIVAPTITAAAPGSIPLPIGVGPSGVLPRNCFVRVRGLPPTVSLTEGYVTAPGAWSLPIGALLGLKMIVPVDVGGSFDLNISLVAEDGVVLAEAKALLAVVPAPQSAPEQVSADPHSQSAPLAPQVPIMSPAVREAAERLVARGEKEMEQGGVAVARQFFLRAAQEGLARGALLLAATYDPRELARSGVRGVQPNIAEARKWYQRARELGAPEAEERLARLGGD
jgi:hypothetical protein